MRYLSVCRLPVALPAVYHVVFSTVCSPLSAGQSAGRLCRLCRLSVVSACSLPAVLSAVFSTICLQGSVCSTLCRQALQALSAVNMELPPESGSPGVVYLSVGL